MFTRTLSIARRLATPRPCPSVATVAPLLRSSSTQSSFYYLRPLPVYKGTKPYYINLPPWAIPDGRNTNEESAAYDLTVSDLRGREAEFTLDKNGFQIVRETQARNDTVVGSLPWELRWDTEVVRRAVAPAVERLLQNFLGAETAIAFSFRTRRRDAQFPALPRGNDPNIPQPVQGVHVDFTPGHSRTIAKALCARNNIPNLHNRRWGIISVWRPLFGPLQDWPLGVLDYTSLDVTNDLIASDNIYPYEIKENYNVFYNPKHHWCYLSDHEPNELLLFKAFDTERGPGVARVCPHAAFSHPDTPSDARPRESVECLSLVIYPEGSAKQYEIEEVSLTKLLRPVY